MNSEISILLIEDDVVDVKIVKRAFKEINITNPLHVVSNGEEALKFLKHEAPYTDRMDAPEPGLILLDLNMPIMDGIAFLDAYRSDPELKHIPSIVLTTSDEERDRRQSYAIGIAGYILKPVGFNEFVDAVRQIDGYWSLCELPVAG
ncbi:MAG TPA: response regulator [Phycisphaerae bacterium]|nr:response regulator [Phycisphaerae bacterium]